ncbi:1320_t:CDS:2 [Funneliformis geosporum]|nr:1320_t:CDS:2 [Funneliformis geosporum]
MYYDVDIGYCFLFESCQYRIGTTIRSVPESLVVLKDLLRLKDRVNPVMAFGHGQG